MLLSKTFAMKTFLAFSIFCLSAIVATVARGERPNIIMFLIDDQNPSSIAAFGGDTYTPNLDRMAEEGMKFTRAYVSSSVCTPSRYSFLTGRFAGNSYSKRYTAEVSGKENHLMKDGLVLMMPMPSSYVTRSSAGMIVMKHG